jgi:PleD family two-component response regulator
MAVPRRLLLVEDSGVDAFFLIRELKRGGYDPTYKRVESSEAMEAALDLLEHIRSDERTRHLPVVVLTPSKEEQDRMNSYKNGSNSYIHEPANFIKICQNTPQLRWGDEWTALSPGGERVRVRGKRSYHHPHLIPPPSETVSQRGKW